MPKKPRDYTQATKYESSPKQIANRSARNKARREMAKEGKVHKGDGMDVDHITPLDLGGSKLSKKNLRVVTKSANRSYKRKPDGSPA